MAIPPRQLHAHSVIRRGVLTPAALRNGAWQSVFRGLYVDSRLVHDHRRRCVEAVATLPSGAAIAGRSAAYLYGAGTVGPDEPIEVVRAVRAADVRVRGELRITSPARTCWDLARSLDAVSAGALVDALVRSRVVAVADLVTYARARAGVAGWRRLLAVVRSGRRGVNGN